MLLSHKGRQYALAIDWASAMDSAELRRETKRRGSGAHRVVRPVAGRFWVGHYTGPVKGQAYAAAFAVAQIEPNLVVCQQVSDTHCWVCAVQDGLPNVGHDQLVPLHEARELAAEWTAQFSKSVFVGDLPGARCAVPELLDAFEELVAAKGVTKKDLAGMRLRRQGTPAVAAARLVAIALVAASAGWGWQYWQKVRLASQARQLSMANAAKQALNAEQAEADRRRRAQAFQNLVAGRRAELQEVAATSPAPLWRRWNELRAALPVSLHGYTPMSVRCDASSCEVDWQGVGALTQPADKIKLPGAQPSFEPTLSASSKFPVGVPRTPRQLVQFAAEPQALRFALANAASVHVRGLQVDPMEAVTVTPDADLGLKPITVGYRGKWRLTAGGLVNAEEAFRFISAWPAQVTSVKFTSMAADASVSLEGVYAIPAPEAH